MSEVLAIKAGSWLTAMAVEHLSGYVVDNLAKSGLGKWSKNLHSLTTSDELKEIKGVHEDLRLGMNALSASISAVNQGHKEGTAAVLRLLMEQKDARRHDEQLDCFKRAVDAVEDLTSGMYAVGNSRNIDLLDKASTNAQEAARCHNGTFMLKIKAYRLWLATEYTHQATVHSCRDAKQTALTILGRKVLVDEDITDICRTYSSPLASQQRPPEITTPDWPVTEAEQTTLSGCSSPPPNVSEAMKFLLDIISSAAMLEPLDEAVSCRDRVTVDENGTLILGPLAPRNVLFAIGRYCAANPEVAKSYPAVSTVALAEWDAGKEKLAMDIFFLSMGGEDWESNSSWTDDSANLSERFGITTESGHITKISLASNNLQGVLNDELEHLHHLRELVLHGNNIIGAVPPGLQKLIDSKPGMVVKGLPGPSVYGARPGSRSASFANGRSHPFDMVTPALSLQEVSTPSSLSFLETPKSEISGSGKKTAKKKGSFRSIAKFLKSSIGSQFDSGFQATCVTCYGPMRPNKQKTGMFCPQCTGETIVCPDDSVSVSGR